METQRTAESLLDLLDRLDLPPASWVATDADGTLWSGDLADTSYERLLAERRVLPPAARALRRIVEEAGVDPGGDPYEDAEIIHRLYVEGVVGDGPLIEALTVCYAGWTEAAWRDFGGGVFQNDIAPRVYETTVPLLEGLLARGLRLVVVTGSPRVLVEVALEALGFAGVDLLGIGLSREGDRLGDRLVEPITWGAGKVEALRPLLQGAPLEAAFGDTLGDLRLLESAERLRVLVHPRPNLRAAAEERSGRDAGRWCLLAPERAADGTRVVPPEVDRAVV